MTTKPTQRRLVSIKRAAEYADCHVRTIERRLNDGTLTRFGRGRMTRVDLNDVDRWLAPAGAR